MKLAKHFPGKSIDSIRYRSKVVRDEKKIPSSVKKWTYAETKRLIEGLKRFGKDYKSVAKHVRTKNATQVSSKARYSQIHKGFPKIKVQK